MFPDLTRDDVFRLDRRMWQSLKSWSHTGYVPHGPATNGSELAQALQ